MRHRRLFLLAVLAVTSTACGTDSSSTGPVAATVTDSAGVTVVSNPAEGIVAAPTWSVSPEPVSVLGDERSPETALSHVVDVLPLAGGRVVVATQFPSRVLVFSSDGTMAAGLGREGEGPGEFSRVTNVAPFGGDSVGVWDGGRRILAVFTLGGTFVRQVDLQDAPGGARTFPTIKSTPSGSLVLFRLANFPEERQSGIFRLSTASPVLNRDGEPVASLGPFPGTQLFQVERMTGTPPFGALSFGVTTGERFVFADTNHPELRVYRLDGALERLIRWPDHERVVTDAMTDAFKDAAVSRVPEEGRAAARRQFDMIPAPERGPAFWDLLTGDGGGLWVGDYPGPTAVVRATPMPQRHWLVFDADGAIAATAVTPAGFQPMAVRDGRVYGVFKDELDVETVRAYTLVKP